MPKNEKWICRCGAKFSTQGQLSSHVRKGQMREDAGFDKEGHHSYRCLIREGAVVDHED